MARNTADLRDEIMIRDRSLLSAYAWVIRASLFESLGFSANFLPSPRIARKTASRQSSIFRIKSCSPLLPLFHSTSSSLLYLATSVLTLIPGDPSTRVVALITCRKCFSSMREKGSPSRRIGVFRFVFSFYFSLCFFSFGGEHLAGVVGYSGTCKRGRATSRAWEVGAWRTGYASTTHAFLFFSTPPFVDVDTNRENFESDLTRREQRDLLNFFSFDGSVVC